MKKLIGMHLKYKKFLLLIFIFLVCTSSKTSNIENEEIAGYYKTYNDFVKHKLTTFEKLKDLAYSFKKTFLVFRDNGKNVKINVDDIWGFVYKDALFRSDGNHDFGRVISTGKIVYYESGVGHFNMLKRKKDVVELFAPMQYLSNDLKSEMVTFKDKEYEAFFKANRKHKQLYDCLEIANKSMLQRIEENRECIAKYNAGDENSK